MKTYFRIYSMLVLLFVGSASLMAQDDDPFGDFDYHKWAGSMTMAAQVRQNGVTITDGIVTAFVDDEMRAKKFIGAGTNPDIAFLTIHGDYNNEHQYLQFKVYTNGHLYTFDPTPAIDFEDYWKKNIGTASDPFIIPIPTPLDDKGDNSSVLNTWAGQTIDVILYDRTLYCDGDWNTLCLPFDVVLDGSPLDGATARPLTEASISGTTLNLTFGNAVTTLQAGTPYIIKWASGDNIVSPVFSGVTIDATDRIYDNEASGDQRVRFIGTYKSTSFDAEDKSILFMGDGNKLYYPESGASIGAQRAYFKIGSGEALARQLTAFRINFGEDHATGIISVHGSGSMVSGSDAWYTLDGRRLSQKPSRAGVYINKGNKVVIK